VNYGFLGGAAEAFCAIKNGSWSFALGFCFFFAKKKENEK
jgi:hypothetical protein